MWQRLVTCIACVSFVLGTLSAADKRGQTNDSNNEQLPTLMVTRAKQILDDPFTKESWAKNWRAYKGGYEIDGDHLRVAENKADGHHPEASHRGPFKNVIVQFKFRLDGSPWMGFSFSDKEHVARVMIRPDSFDLLKMSGIGSTTKSTRLDRMPMKWEPGKWYTMVIELHENEILAHIDSKYILYGETEGLNVSKGRIALISGGQYARYDDMKVWEVDADPKWAKRKPLLLKEKEKRK